MASSDRSKRRSRFGLWQYIAVAALGFTLVACVVWYSGMQREKRGGEDVVSEHNPSSATFNDRWSDSDEDPLNTEVSSVASSTDATQAAASP